MTRLLLGALLGAVAGLLAARAWRRAPRFERGADPALLPEPALGWLRRAHGALGAFASDPRRDGSEAVLARDLDRSARHLAELPAIEDRVIRAQRAERGGVERLDAGTLVVVAEDGLAAAVLLRPDADPDLGLLERDLRQLLEGVRRRPRLTPLAEAERSPGRLETVESVGYRLAMHVEQVTRGEVIVAARLMTGVTVVGLGGTTDPRLSGLTAEPGTPLALMAEQGGEPRELADHPLGEVAGDRRRPRGPAMLFGIESEGQPVGAVALWAPPGGEIPASALAQAEVAIHAAGPRLARAIEAHRRKVEATLDPLTGLLNRRGFEEATRRVGLRRAAYIACDLDRFKRLNDTYGHPAGDAALVHFARVLQEQVRNIDHAARVGGEEFAVLLPETALEEARAVAERIRLAIETESFLWEGQRIPLTASFGVSACPESTRHLENLAAQADGALYTAKQGGRNRVVLAVPLLD